MKPLIFCFALVALCYADDRYVEEENGNLAEGDMVLSPAQRALFMAGELSYASSKNLWPRRKPIPYYIERSLRGTAGERAIKKAIREYETKTCLRFVRRKRASRYLSFYRGGGCSSPVGYGPGRRRISLARGCWRIGTVMHEIGHSIGLYHEQSRPDRDKYITILWNNIKSKNKFNFRKVRYGSHGTGYDFRSMMHYPGKAFSRNGKYTIKTKKSKYQHLIGQRKGFSSTDIRQIKKMYGCSRRG